MQDEFSTADRALQIGLEPQAIIPLLLHARGEDQETLALALGLIHRTIGAPQEIAHLVAMRRKKRDAEARRDAYIRVPEHHRFLQGAHKFAGHGLRALLGRHRWQQDREFVAAQTHGGVGLAQLAQKPHRGLLKKAVASMVPEAVIYVFETVEVDDHKGEWRRLPVRATYRLQQAVLQEDVFGQSGQGVVHGQIFELAIGDREGQGPFMDALLQTLVQGQDFRVPARSLVLQGLELRRHRVEPFCNTYTNLAITD